MATTRQFARMAAVRSTLGLIRHRQLTPGYNLVVSGGAYAPDTKPLSDNFTINKNESLVPYDVDSPHFPPLTPASCAPLGHHLVVAGGVTLSPPCTNVYFALDLNDHVLPHRIFHPRCACIDPLALVVPGRFWLWRRAGIG